LLASVSARSAPVSIQRRTVSSLTLKNAAASRIRIFGTMSSLDHRMGL